VIRSRLRPRDLTLIALRYDTIGALGLLLGMRELASSANPGHVDRHMGWSRVRRVDLDQLGTESGQLSPNRLAGLVREARRPREQPLVVAAVVCLS
jgi:hypothetical protein